MESTVSMHYPNLAASTTAACDHRGGPARTAADAFWQAYRQEAGFVFLCGSCVGEHHAVYAATRVSPPSSGRSLRPSGDRRRY
jgi:hypothetical protein